MPTDGSSFYYYDGDTRIPLMPSLKWITVKFTSADPAIQSAALQGSIAGPLDQSRRIPNPEMILLPLQVGLATEQLVQGINSLRARTADFLQVNPVFETGDAEMIITDEFIATFPAEQGKEEIENLNFSNGVEMVAPILGQENTFVLRVTAHARLDALAMANLYQESHTALRAAPNFLRLTKIRSF